MGKRKKQEKKKLLDFLLSRLFEDKVNRRRTRKKKFYWVLHKACHASPFTTLCVSLYSIVRRCCYDYCRVYTNRVCFSSNVTIGCQQVYAQDFSSLSALFLCFLFDLLLCYMCLVNYMLIYIYTVSCVVSVYAYNKNLVLKKKIKRKEMVFLMVQRGRTGRNKVPFRPFPFLIIW